MRIYEIWYFVRDCMRLCEGGNPAIVNFEQISPCSVVSIIDFEQAPVGTFPESDLTLPYQFPSFLCNLSERTHFASFP